jgi:hypothetical protein
VSRHGEGEEEAVVEERRMKELQELLEQHARVRAELWLHEMADHAAA